MWAGNIASYWVRSSEWGDGYVVAGKMARFRKAQHRLGVGRGALQGACHILYVQDGACGHQLREEAALVSGARQLRPPSLPTHLVLLYDIPAAAGVGVCGCGGKQHLRHAAQQRAVCDVPARCTMARSGLRSGTIAIGGATWIGPVGTVRSLLGATCLQYCGTACLLDLRPSSGQRPSP